MLDNNSKFSYVPGTRASRSIFDLSNSVKTSFDAAQLVPFYYEEVLPGDTFNVETNLIARMQTLVAPVMDDLYLDFFYFFVPNRIVWDHWKEFMGENTKSAWYPETEYNVPQISVAPSKSVAPKSVADYFGIPPITVPQGEGDPFTFSALPFRAYAEIWNEWFRDENLQDPVLVDHGDSTHTYDSTSAVDGGALLFANKYHDYFTSALPSPQKGADVTIPIDTFAPVYPVSPSVSANANRSYPLAATEIRNVGDAEFSAGIKNIVVGTNAGDDPTGLSRQVQTYGVSGSAGGSGVYFSNLIADMQSVPATSINQLRLAFATQALLEKDARGGTRYREIIKSHFATNSPDARQQIPELLSYNRIPIQINQVVQNSSSTDNSPQGNTAAYSLTADSDGSFMKSFTEHGMVIGVMCARYKHTYQQGLDKRFTRKTRFDYYWPLLANLGEQPILNREIYAQGTPTDNEVFGYQEAWSEYRYKPDICTSEMRSTYPQSLDVWHFGDNYKSLPTLSSGWIQEDLNNINRALAVSSSVSNQFFADIYIKNKATRVMPVYSIPGMPRTL